MTHYKISYVVAKDLIEEGKKEKQCVVMDKTLKEKWDASAFSHYFMLLT